jgi:hypothetical protein
MKTEEQQLIAYRPFSLQEMAETEAQECFNVSDFAQEAGLSKQRLYQLWEKGDGPPRFTRQLPGRRWHTVCIPKKEGLAWIKRRYGASPWRS